MKIKYQVSEVYNFSDCREITGDELFFINGGARIENSNEAVANAQVGDTLVRDNKEVVTISQVDIDYAKDHLGGGNSSSAEIPPGDTVPVGCEPAVETRLTDTTGSAPTTTSNTSSPSGNSSTSSTQTTQTNNSGNLTDRGYPSSMDGYKNSSTIANTPVANNKNSVQKSSGSAVTGYYDSQDPKRYITDLDNRKALQHAADLLADPNSELIVMAYGSESSNTRTFKNYAEINHYLNDNQTENKKSVVNSLKPFIENVNSPSVYTFGISGNATVAIESQACSAGIYIDPKSEKLLKLSNLLMKQNNTVIKAIGVSLLATNIDDFGVYFGIEAGPGISTSSASIGITLGNFCSKDDVKGSYVSYGASGGLNGISLGYDYITSLDGNAVGNITSLGFGVGAAYAEGHARIGVTGVISLQNK